MNISVLIADDHRIMSSGIAAILDGLPDIKVVGSVCDGRAAVAEALKLQPTVVLMDIHMAGMNGIEATWKIVEALPDTKVIALSMYADNCYVDGMLDAGASGYLLKTAAMKELVEAIRRVAAGETYLGQSLVVSVPQACGCRCPAVLPGSAQQKQEEEEVY